MLYKKNINETISPASLTKLMTALLLYENSSLNVWKIGALNAEGSTFGGNIQNYAQRGVVTVTEIKQ